MRKRDLIARLPALVGEDVVRVVDELDGWPSLVRIQLQNESLLAAVHIGPVGLSHRNRDNVERRFQNPGQGRPIRTDQGAIPLLLGVWEQGRHPVLVGMEAEARMGRSTRQSLFIPLWLLEQAACTGWAEHYSTTEERIIAFHPALLSTYVETRRSNLRLEAEQIQGIVDASGLTSPPEEQPQERARRASLALVRSARFAKKVVDAYNGLCAFCGLNFGLVEGAHIYPVQAPASVDEVWNGLALCSNHHSAFDRHLLWVDPHTRTVRVHPKILASAADNAAARLFSEMTYSELLAPASESSLPRQEMFERRYEFFDEKYSWAVA
jgi:HNH endonuclease